MLNNDSSIGAVVVDVVFISISLIWLKYVYTFFRLDAVKNQTELLILISMVNCETCAKLRKTVKAHLHNQEKRSQYFLTFHTFHAFRHA